jgi:predicted RNase H-like HicB family nuclease
MLSTITVSLTVHSDRWFVGSVPELFGCHSQAGSLDGLILRMREAVDLYLDVEGLIVDSQCEFFGVKFLEVPLRES